MKFRPVVLILLLIGISYPAFSQDDWEKVSYQNWSKDEVKKILTNSPWVKVVNLEYRLGEETATIMLRSALPIRQALLRKRQIDSKYDKMSDTDKKKFDEKNKALLECPACSNYYVVSIFYDTFMLSNPNFVNDRKKYIYLLNDNGEKRELLNFTPQSKGNNYEAVFFFPRINEKGEPLLTGKSKKLIFRFDIRSEDGKGDFPFSKAEFDVSDFIKNGEVVF